MYRQSEVLKCIIRTFSEELTHLDAPFLYHDANHFGKTCCGIVVRELRESCGKMFYERVCYNRQNRLTEGVA